MTSRAVGTSKLAHHNKPGRMNSGLMDRIAVGCLFLLPWLAGCYVPIGPDPGHTNVAQGRRPPQELRPPQERSHGSSKALSDRHESPFALSDRQLIVRGEVIDADDLWREQQKDLVAQSNGVPADEYNKLVSQRAYHWINDKMAEALLYHKASLRMNPEVERRINKFVDSDIRRVVTTEFNGVQRRYERHLESQGSSLDDERTRRRREIIVSSYLESEIKPKIARPTRADLMAAFEANRDAWRRPSRRRMSLIDVRVTEFLGENVTTPSREEMHAARESGRSLVETIQSELAGGVPFEDVATRHSHGLHAEEGGSWGWVSPEGVRERFKPAVDELYKLEEGRVSDPIETPDGFLLVRCDEIDPGYEPTFEAIQPELQQRHFRNTYNQLVSELVVQLKRDAGIDSAALERFHAVLVDTTLSKTLE